MTGRKSLPEAVSGGQGRGRPRRRCRGGEDPIDIVPQSPSPERVDSDNSLSEAETPAVRGRRGRPRALSHGPGRKGRPRSLSRGSIRAGRPHSLTRRSGRRSAPIYIASHSPSSENVDSESSVESIAVKGRGGRPRSLRRGLKRQGRPRSLSRGRSRGSTPINIAPHTAMPENEDPDSPVESIVIPTPPVTGAIRKSVARERRARPRLRSTDRDVSVNIAPHSDDDNSSTSSPPRRTKGERDIRYRKNMSAERAEEIRRQNVAQHQQRRSELPPPRAEEIRRQNVAQHQQQRSQLPPPRAEEIRRQDAAKHQQQRSQLPPPRAEEIRRQNVAQHRQQYHRSAAASAASLSALYDAFIEPNQLNNDAPRFNEDLVQEHSCGPFNIVCVFCKAVHFKDEQTRDGHFTSCCRKGRLKLPPPKRPYPRFLRDALTVKNSVDYGSLRPFTRNYNSALSFVSLGANISPPQGRGPYCFRAQGTVHHHMESLNVPAIDGEPEQRYAQLYILDSMTQATEIRAAHPANEGMNTRLLRKITDYIMEHNHYAELFQSVNELEIENERVELVFNREYTMPDVHPGRQNEVVAQNEVAAVFVLENDGVPNFHRDFRIYVRNQGDKERLKSYINPQSPHLDPLCYALFFINGEPGWHVKWRCRPYPQQQAQQRDQQGLNVNEDSAVSDENAAASDEVAEPGRHFSMLQYNAAMLQVREEPWRPILHAGNLTQQYIVESYLGVESNNLDWVRFNQDKLRANQYHALQNFVQRHAERAGVVPARAVILPSTFTGSNRNMRELCLDAMAIFAYFGRPDLFITFTCNPRWTDITKNLLEGEKPHDRPDIVSRVFSIKLKALMHNIVVKGLFGPVVSYVYTIEFQKRGLPHAHILVTLQAGSKPDDPDAIDRIVCAELPDPIENPRLFEIVKCVMIHGPCRAGLCLEDGKCKRGFPKRPAEETKLIAKSYPDYRRRAQGDHVVEGGRKINNGNVVPYNPCLLLEFNAHINVEVITNMLAAVKYVYKYIFKGFDVASLNFIRDGELNVDEVKNFINCRYVSSPEAIWRLFEFKTHDRSHAVIRLPIHLENPIELNFDEGLEIAPEREPEIAKTMLEAFFSLCETLFNSGVQGHGLLYRDVVKGYIFNARQRCWKPRQQRGEKVIARIRDINPSNVEMFSLRVLLLNVRGPRSFPHIRNVAGVQYETYREAAQALNLVRDDQVFFRTFDDLIELRMPPQLRQAFATMLTMKIITSGKVFWDRYKQHMIEDFRQSNQNATDDYLCNLALHDLNSRFARSGKNCSNFGLPSPQGAPSTLPQPALLPARVSDIVLNTAQKFAFERIMAAARTVGQPNPEQQQQQRCFTIIGPGGCGKTTLYKKIIEACRADKLVARVFATTGIAATLMEGGMTVHRGFGLPIGMTSESSSRLQSNPNQSECKELKNTDVILIDEITMLVKDGLRIIDNVLRFIMNVDRVFGGKVIVVGGDFRQLLPVVPRGARPQIIAECVISSTLWRHFQVINLTDNMRAQGDPEYVEWLLKLGSGSLPSIDGIESPNMVEIPQQMLLQVPPQPRQRGRAKAAAIDPDEMPIELKAMIERVFGHDVNLLTPHELASMAILASTVKEVMKVNNHMIASLNGEAHSYLSVDELISDDTTDILYPIEVLNQQQPSGMPPHVLTLKVGVVVMLLRNLDPDNGLSNGTRLIVIKMLPNAIVAKILSESHRDEICFIARMDTTATDITMPFQLRRQQFPLIPAYAMTINKSQGQTIEHVGIFLNDVVFAHGQLYVAMSRSRMRRNVTVFVKDQSLRQGHLLKHLSGQQHRVFTKNVVYREVFQHGELQHGAAAPNFVELDPEIFDAEMMQRLLEVVEEEEVRMSLADEGIFGDLAQMLDRFEADDNFTNFNDYINQHLDIDIADNDNIEVINNDDKMMFDGAENRSENEKALHRLELESMRNREHRRWLAAFCLYNKGLDQPEPNDDFPDVFQGTLVDYFWGLRTNFEMDLPFIDEDEINQHLYEADNVWDLPIAAIINPPNPPKF